jgi:hypothetical protein
MIMWTSRMTNEMSDELRMILVINQFVIRKSKFVIQ